MVKTDCLPHHRYPISVIQTSLLLHHYVPSRTVRIILFFLFRANVSHKTVCQWTQKFGSWGTPAPQYDPDAVLICHADEKYVKVQGKWHYWWSIKDCFGTPLSSIITATRDGDSAKRLCREARRKIGRDVDIFVHDGLTAYEQATKYLGKKCRSVVAGIQGKWVMANGALYRLTNNPAESLNSEIDDYLAKFQQNFANLESANRFAGMFLFQKHLRKCFAEENLSAASSTLEQALAL